jgi:putative endonuclease
MAKHNDLGIEGERIAAEYLRQKGFKILETNWRFEKKEIDIIAKKDGYIVVVEVKSRSTDFFGQPEEFVTPAKQQHLIEAADVYMQQLNFEAEVRFDIISIVLNDKRAELRHIEEAFIPELD